MWPSYNLVTDNRLFSAFLLSPRDELSTEDISSFLEGNPSIYEHPLPRFFPHSVSPHCSALLPLVAEVPSDIGP